MDKKIAVVTGGNRGIGLEVCRQLAKRGYAVVLGSRDLSKGEAAAAGLDGEVIAKKLEVSNPDDVKALATWVAEEYGRLDVLINNAGVNYDADEQATNVDLHQVRKTFEVNVFGAWQVAQAFIPLLKKSEYARLVNVSSGAGSLYEMRGGLPAYGVSKAALNALTRKLAAELKADGILVNAVCPGWTDTDMGGGGHPVSEGAAIVVWAATLDNNGPTNGFFRDGESIAW